MSEFKTLTRAKVSVGDKLPSARHRYHYRPSGLWRSGHA